MFDIQHLEQYKSLEILAKQVVEGFITGLHKSPFHGFSVEFAEHKLYNQGENTKNIDWKLFGRTDKLFSKRFEEETNLRCHLLIDVSSSMNFPNGSKSLSKLNFSIYAAAVLIELLKKQRDAFSLTFFSDDIEYQSQVKSSTLHKMHLFSEMEQLLKKEKDLTQKKSDISSVLHYIAEQIHQRSLVVIFSDALGSNASNEKVLAALQHLRHCKHEVLFFHVFDKSKEVDFEYPSRPYYFIDKETGEKIKLQPEEIKEQYHQAIVEKNRELKNFCTNLRIDYIEANINEGFDTILKTFLLKRKKLY